MVLHSMNRLRRVGEVTANIGLTWKNYQGQRIELNHLIVNAEDTDINPGE
jgi:hypothetical protein